MNDQEEIENQIRTVLASLTLEAKIGQMTQIEKNSVTPEQARIYGLGSVLSGGGGNPDPVNSPSTWREMVTGYTHCGAAVPLLYGSDAVHGHNNCRDATIFPHNIAMGCARSPALMRRIGAAVGLECMATGVNWDFAPCVAVAQDLRWGRSYESFSSDPALVASLAAAFLRGLRDSGVLGCAKHFIGDGATRWDSPRSHYLASHRDTPMPWDPPRHDDDWRIDTATCYLTEEQLREVLLPPYVAALEAGALSVMVSYSSWHGVPMHRNAALISGLLKQSLGFRGFVVSDWAGVDMDGTEAPSSPEEAQRATQEKIVAAINAGIDMVMVPFKAPEFMQAVKTAVEQGLISHDRIDDAVTRILRAKFSIGLFNSSSSVSSLSSSSSLPDLSIIRSEAHRELAAQAVRECVVLLRGQDCFTPLAPSQSLLLFGPVDDIGFACGGWTISWQGAHGPITAGVSLLQALRDRHPAEKLAVYPEEPQGASDQVVAIVAIGESPYAEGFGDRDWPRVAVSQAHIELVAQARQRCAQVIVVVFSGRPIDLSAILPHADVILAAWWPGSEYGVGLAQLLYGDFPFTGQLSFPWLNV